MINLLKWFILILIGFIESIEYRNTDLDQDDISKKILDTINLDDVLIETDTGWERVSHVHKTQPYDVWRLNLKNGLYLEGADNHILFDQDLNEIFIRDLKPGDLVMTVDGPIQVSSISKLTNTVSMFDVTVDSPNHRYWSNGILSHNTICSSIFIAWYSLFHFDRNSLILSNKGVTTTEIIDKGKTILEHLPFFLKPGVIKWDVFNTKFDNGCRIIGQTTTKKAAIGFTIHLLFMDEFAHIPEQIVHSFYENVYPTVSASPTSKVIITSTPNGFNKFHSLYTAAVKNENEYTPFRVDWWDVPGRDQEWYEKELANLGTEEAFNRQYGNDFVVSSNLLLSPDTLKNLKKNEVEFVYYDIPELDEIEMKYDGLKWHPDFDFENEPADDENYWVFSIDLGAGNGGDYSVINIFRIEIMDQKDFKRIKSPGTFQDFFRLKQVGVFRSNEHTIEEFAKILYVIAFDHFYSENLKMVVEWNMFGSELLKRLETVFPQRNNFDEETIVKFKHRADAKVAKHGLKLKSDNKTIFCQNFKKLAAQRRILFYDEDTVHEAGVFGKMPNGSYAGQSGHDDMIMTCVNVSEFLTTVDFSEFAEERYDYVDESIQAEIDEILENDKDGGDLNYDIYALV